MVVECLLAKIVLLIGHGDPDTEVNEWCIGSPMGEGWGS